MRPPPPPCLSSSHVWKLDSFGQPHSTSRHKQNLRVSFLAAHSEVFCCVDAPDCLFIVEHFFSYIFIQLFFFKKLHVFHIFFLHISINFLSTKIYVLAAGVCLRTHFSRRVCESRHLFSEQTSQQNNK